MNFNNYNKPIRLIELFAGIGSQAKALKNIGANFEHWRVCEFDEHALRSYNAVHGTNFVTSDITKLTASDLSIVDTEHFTYLLTYSFPCQDLSNAGKGRGMEKGSGTRSGLLWEVERLLNECDELPQVLLMENVPQVHGKKNIEHFEKWIAFLESKGYSNHWQDLNAKDYGIPQNRNRCFMVSILGDYTYYEFPEAIPLTLKLGDMLEADVDEKYYLSDKHLHKISQWNAQQKPLSRVLGNNSLSPTLTARGAGEYHSGMVLLSEELDETCNLESHIKQPSNTSELKRTLCNELLEKDLVGEHDVIRHSYTNNRLNNGDKNMARTQSKDKLCPTLDTRSDCFGVVVKEPTELQKEVCDKAIENGMVSPYDIIDYTYSNARLEEMRDGKLKTKNSTDNQVANTLTTNVENMGVCVPSDVKPRVIGGVGEKKSNGGSQWYQQDRIYDADKVAISVTTAFNPYYGSQSLRIRKLTPRECWRLMGFDDEDFLKAEKVCSNSQLYKQAGNSIVVNVLMAIFKELFVPKKTRSEWLDELLNN
jgi:DNA (cytosine-5)-methyltransferase 1